MMLKIFIATVLLLLLAFALFSVRLIFKKNGEFRGTCANNNPFLQKEGATCGVCGRKAGEPCNEQTP